ncbi:HPr kinase/phosphorylase [Chelatococcus reniformis]|uniref:HPr kinase n=1 Tax=Chelatococcus reniformis TaxID=1494448 RepID=A0A916X8K9_9HYPH|nr:serine/threonine protein kinase [Chelatococcus reniformis]GGC52140.1 HPr kinase [Chelatococcus reniformis]
MNGTTVHAGCVLVGEAGVLIRGDSGTGKSQLGLRLMAAARGRGLFASLVADDRTRLAVNGGRLIARPVPAIAGRCEIRGVGIVGLVNEGAAVVRLVVDCSHEQPERLPAAASRSAAIEGIVIDRLQVRVDDGVEAVVWAVLEQVLDR